MPLIRLILLLVVLGSLTLLLVQNWSPVLPLVFLGMSTQALPLAVWILLSVAAGAFTSLVITGFFKMSNYFARSPRKRGKVETPPPRSSVQSPPPRSNAQSSETQYTAARTSPPAPDSNLNDDFNEWGSGSTSGDDWDFEEETDKAPNVSARNTARDYTNYEVSGEPKSSSRSGSVYSYSYRDPSNSSVGKTESVYDADYRVLTPPYQVKNPAQNKAKDEDEDDWGLDDDFEDEGESDRR